VLAATSRNPVGSAAPTSVVFGAKAAGSATVDQLRIGSVSDATWTPVGTTEPGTTGTFWTPAAATEAAAVRVRPDNGRFQGDWVQGEAFPVTVKQGG
jgi:hypothetical protein